MMNQNKPFFVQIGNVQEQPAQVDELNKSARMEIHRIIDNLLPTQGVIVDITQNTKQAMLDISVKFLELNHTSVFSRYDKFSSAFLSAKEEFFLNGASSRIFELIEFVHIHFIHVAGIQTGGEFLSEIDNKREYLLRINKYCNDINSIMVSNNVGYEFTEGKFIKITNEEELEEVNRATKTPYKNANNHITKAIGLFSDRENPDYANTIKESILAVEAAVKELVDDDKATLGAALAKLEKSGVAIHPAFKAALSQLYGFTSDAAGIRHGGKCEPIQQDQATARFMLITCSAFVNYLIANSPTGEK